MWLRLSVCNRQGLAVLVLSLALYSPKCVEKEKFCEVRGSKLPRPAAFRGVRTGLCGGFDRLVCHRPVGLASLLSGLIMSLGTKWGLVRHYWVLISLVLTIIAPVVLLVETQRISHFADTAANPATSGEDLRALGSTLVHSVGGAVVLLVILVLNTYKPRGMTPYGWRKQEEQRKKKSPAK
jgi:hypothetical protein